MELFPEAGFVAGIIFISTAIILIPAIFFLLTQQNTLKQIQPQNRLMSPGEVWLQLIPIFGLVWMFFVVSRIAQSLQREFAASSGFSFDDNDNGYASAGEKPTYSIGIAYCILACCSIIPVIGILASLASLVCWIIYWVQLADCKRKLALIRYHQPTSASLP